MTIDFRFDANRLQAGLGNLSEKLLPYMKTTWLYIAQDVLEEVRAATPPTRTGTDLKALWTLDRDEVGAVTEFIIHNLYPDPQVILWFEEGTRAHTIPIGKAGFLHFFTDEGEEVYTKRPVQHPGTVAWLMAEKGRRRGEELLGRYIEETFAMVERFLEGQE
jgi:hypothetical protein